MASRGRGHHKNSATIQFISSKTNQNKKKKKKCRKNEIKTLINVIGFIKDLYSI
jgi:hypothetical protein